jgi:hypothetical protein
VGFGVLNSTSLLIHAWLIGGEAPVHLDSTLLVASITGTIVAGLLVRRRRNSIQEELRITAADVVSRIASRPGSDTLEVLGDEVLIRLLAKLAGTRIETMRVRARYLTNKLSNDQRFEEKLIDVVGLYLNPPDKAIVLCMDEKSSVQAMDRTQPSLPMVPGRGKTMTHDYKRKRDHDVVRGVGRADRSGDRVLPPQTSPPGVHQVPESGRSTNPERP